MIDKQKNYVKIKEFALNAGANLFGVADISGNRVEFDDEIAGIASKMPFAVVIAVKLSRSVLATVNDRPTKIYKTHYKSANTRLDFLAFSVGREIELLGYNALPIPASYITDWQKQKAHAGHKNLAELAGIGWRGRNNLLVSPEYGPLIRLVSVLTDMPLETDKPLAFGCGDCFECIDCCPAGAIKEKVEDFDHIACFEILRQFMKYKNFGQYICGICITKCPLSDGRDTKS